jgi:hypothetical protein
MLAERVAPAWNNGVLMKIDIDKLTEAELVDLNHRIVARLRLLNQMRAHAEMLEFKIGDRVSFRPSGTGRIEGILTRYNRKTVTIITDDGRQWNVSPQFLSKVLQAETGSADRSALALIEKASPHE